MPFGTKEEEEQTSTTLSLTSTLNSVPNGKICSVQ